ncbi:MAG: GNAT family N-acetyltransferase [Propionibacteriaceae bacterium]
MTSGVPGSARIRAATRHDVPAVLAIYNHAVEHTTATYDLVPVSLPERLHWYDRKVVEDWPVLVAVGDNGTVLGWSTYGAYRGKAGYRHTVEHSVYVAEDVRRDGIGSALLVPLIEHARAGGRHVMIAGVDADNTGSIVFHQRHGFVETGRLREVVRKFDRWLDIAFLQLTL